MAKQSQPEAPRRLKRGYRIVVESTTPKRPLISVAVEAATIREAMCEAYKKLSLWEGEEDADIDAAAGIAAGEFFIDRPAEATSKSTAEPAAPPAQDSGSEGEEKVRKKPGRRKKTLAAEQITLLL